MKLQLLNYFKCYHMAPQFNTYTDDLGSFLFECPVIKLVILYVTA